VVNYTFDLLPAFVFIPSFEKVEIPTQHLKNSARAGLGACRVLHEEKSCP
jgi:hypothetical protein